jgi:hypothetical protein
VFDYRRFWSVDETLTRGAFRVHMLGGYDDQLLAAEKGELEPIQPLRFHHDQGSRLKDVIGTTSATLLFSDRFVTVLADGGFSGWRTYPVEVFDAHGDIVPGYHGLVVTGGSGPLVDSLSPVMEAPPVVQGGKVPLLRIGIRFHSESWDGSDVFRPSGTTYTLVTQEVRDALVAAKVTNLDLKRITEIETLVYGAELDEYERRRQ